MKRLKLILTGFLVGCIPLLVQAQLTQRTNQGNGRLQSGGTLEHFGSASGVRSHEIGSQGGVTTIPGFLSFQIGDFDRDPVIENTDFEFTWDENTPEGTTLVQIIASDKDFPTVLEYSVDTDTFEIDGSGLITLASGYPLDYETYQQVEFDVTVSDGSNAVMQTITVYINDLDELPVISTTSLDVNEDEEVDGVVGNVAASDPEGNPVSYTLVSGNTNLTFELDANSGDLILKQPLDFETETTFILGVSVSDGARVEVADVTVNIQDVNEAPLVADLDYVVSENATNTTVFGQIDADDPEDATLNYSIESGNTNSVFDINAGGELLVNDDTQLDFEAIPQYELVVRVNDGALNTDVSITVYVDDVVENRAPIAVDPGIVLPYSPPNGIIILEGFDPDGDAVVYEIVDDPSSGVLNTTANPNKFTFTPGASQQPDTQYNDNFTFAIIEAAGDELSSDTVQIDFVYEVEDQPHTISDLSASGNITSATVDIVWDDPVQNPTYSVQIEYFDLTGPAPELLTVFDQSYTIGELNVNASEVSTQEVVAGNFNATNVVFLVTVSTPGGSSDTRSFVYDGINGISTLASPDGLFFAYGSRMTVPEGKTVNLKMLAVELSAFDLSGSTISLTTDPLYGTIGSPSIVDQTSNTITWSAVYTSTGEIANKDSVKFEVTHAGRADFVDEAWAVVEIVGSNDPPHFSEISNQTVDEDNTFELSLDVTDPDNEITFSVTTTEASNVSASVNDGTLTVIPNENFNGSVGINITATEVGGSQPLSAFESFELDILPVNDAPVMNTIPDQVVDEDGQISIQVSASDVDAGSPIFTYAAQTLAASGISYTIVGSTITIIPDANLNGEFQVAVTADDGESQSSESAQEIFTLTVNPVNDAPISTAIPVQNKTAGFPDYNLNLANYFSDIDGDNLQYSFTGAVNIGLTSSGNTLTVDVGESFTGTENVIVTATDGVLQTSQILKFAVSSANLDLLVANPIGDQTYDEDFSDVQIPISDVFAESGNPAAVFDYELFADGTIDVSLNNDSTALIISAPANYNGTESVIFSGVKQGDVIFETFNITVNPVNDLPVVTSLGDQTTNEDQALSNVLIDVSDIDTDLEDLVITASSSDESIVKSSSIDVQFVGGEYRITLTPEPDAYGTLTISYNVMDGLLEVDQSFQLTIDPVNDSPIIVTNTLSDATEDQLYSQDLSTFFDDIDGDNLTINVVQKPSWAALDGSVLSGTPDNSQVGSYLIEVSATDPSSASVTGFYSFDVINVNDAPTVLNEISELTIASGNELSYEIPGTTFEDVDEGDQLTLTLTSGPSWLSISGTTLSGIPAKTDAGTQLVEITATDLVGAKVSTTFNVVVSTTTFNPTIALVIPEVCFGSDFTVSASGANDFNWYNDSGDLLQSGGDSYTGSSSTLTKILVEGIDTDGSIAETREEAVISILPSPSITITAEGSTISVEGEAGATFQWYQEGTPLQGETGKVITPEQDGSYYVIAISENGCSTTSETIDFEVEEEKEEEEVLGIEGEISTISTYPNPTTDWVTIEGVNAGATIRFVNMRGSILNLPVNESAKAVRFDLTELPTGVYLLQILENDKIKQLKVIKRP